MIFGYYEIKTVFNQILSISKSFFRFSPSSFICFIIASIRFLNIFESIFPDLNVRVAVKIQPESLLLKINEPPLMIIYNKLIKK